MNLRRRHILKGGLATGSIFLSAALQTLLAYATSPTCSTGC
jgi:hypothetical protein